MVPIDPTVELFARSLARQRRKKKRRKKKKHHRHHHHRRHLSNTGTVSPNPSSSAKSLLKKKLKLKSKKWKLAGKKMRKTIVAGVPVVGGTVGVPYSTCASHVKEVEDSMLYQGNISRTTESLTLAASYLINKLRKPLFKIHVKITLVDKKPLCEYFPPLTSFDEKLKNMLKGAVEIGSEIKPINIDILQPPENAGSQRDERGHFYFKNKTAIVNSEAYVANRIRTVSALLRGNMAYLGSFVLSLQTFQEFFAIELDKYVASLKVQLGEQSAALTN